MDEVSGGGGGKNNLTMPLTLLGVSQRDSDSTVVISCGTRDLHLPQAQLEGEGQRKNQCLKSESILSLAISAASPGG